MTMERAYLSPGEGFAACCWNAPSREAPEELFTRTGTPFEKMQEVEEITSESPILRKDRQVHGNPEAGSKAAFFSQFGPSPRDPARRAARAMKSPMSSSSGLFPGSMPAASKRARPSPAGASPAVSIAL